MGCTEGSVLRQLSAPRHLSGKGLSRQTQLLLPTLTYLPRGLGTQLTPHDLEILKKKKKKKKKALLQDQNLEGLPLLGLSTLSLETETMIFKGAVFLFPYRSGGQCASSPDFLNQGDDRLLCLRSHQQNRARKWTRRISCASDHSPKGLPVSAKGNRDLGYQCIQTHNKYPPSNLREE